MSPIIRDFIIQERAFTTLQFTVTDEDLSGLQIRFRLADEDGADTNLIEKNESDMSVSGDTATLELSTSDTDLTGEKHYELWIEWAAGEWTPQFEGSVTFRPSLVYTP